MATPSTVADALVNVARTVHTARSMDETLSAIVDSALVSVPGFDHVGLSTVDKRGRITTRAATDPLVDDLDDLQYSLREGPCYVAMQESLNVEVPMIRHEQRWPRYVRHAIERAGLKAQMGLQLYLDGEGTIGGLNFYSTRSETIDPEAREAAHIFAEHAALALGHARRVANLQTALSSSRVIGQSIGMLMERHKIDQDAAFAFLVRVSSESNTKVSVIAQRLVDDGNGVITMAPPATATEPT